MKDKKGKNISDVEARQIIAIAIGYIVAKAIEPAMKQFNKDLKEALYINGGKKN